MICLSRAGQPSLCADLGFITYSPYRGSSHRGFFRGARVPRWEHRTALCKAIVLQ